MMFHVVGYGSTLVFVERLFCKMLRQCFTRTSKMLEREKPSAEKGRRRTTCVI